MTDNVLKRIVQQVETTSPAIVIVDSFQSVMQAAQRQKGRVDLRHFTQEEMDECAHTNRSSHMINGTTAMVYSIGSPSPVWRIAYTRMNEQVHALVAVPADARRPGCWEVSRTPGGSSRRRAAP